MSRWWLIGFGVFLAVLIAGSIAISLIKNEAYFESGTPEAAVQEFLRMLEDEHYDQAYHTLGLELQTGCSIEEFVAQDRFRRDVLRDSRVTLQKTHVFDDTGTVSVRVTRFDSDEPFGASESSHTGSFMLQKDVEGGWRFTRFPGFLVEYPYEFFGCSVPDSPESAPVD